MSTHQPYTPFVAPLRRLVLTTAISLAWVTEASAATINVNGATCTLVEAIQSANSAVPLGNGCSNGEASGLDTLVLTPGSTHNLTAIVDTTDGDNGTPSITSHIIIQAAGSGATIRRSGGVEFRLFHIGVGGDLTLSGVTLTGGVANKNLGSSSVGKVGGAILNRGTLILSNTTVSGNSAQNGGAIFGYDDGSNEAFTSVLDSTVLANAVSGSGGGIFNQGTLLLNNSTVSGNTAAFGGGISNFGRYADAQLELVQSSVSGNSAFASGGGIDNPNTLTLYNSTVLGNSAAERGGGIWTTGSVGNPGKTTVKYSTLSGNVASAGAGVYVKQGTVSLSNSTLSGNSASFAGGGAYSGFHGSLILASSTVAFNVADSNGGGIQTNLGGYTSFNNTIISNSGNGDCTLGTGSLNPINSLIQDNSCGATFHGDPKLEPLGFNGGPTKTHALKVGSPAIDAGDDFFCGTWISDQRGSPRIIGAHCDLGAFEGVADTSFFVIPLPSGKTVIFGL